MGSVRPLSWTTGNSISECATDPQARPHVHVLRVTPRMLSLPERRSSGSVTAMKRCQTFCMRVSMLIALVAVLLGAMCLIMLRFPEKDVHMASTDMRLVEAVSNVWCGGQEFVSAHPFSVYRVNDLPPAVPANHIHHTIELSASVPSGKFHYLRYYLLPGSNVTADVMADGPGGTVHAIRGEEELQRCIRTLQEQVEDDYGSSEEDDDDEDTSRRLPAFYRWAIKSKRVHPSDTLDAAHLTFRATAADLYYVLLVNENRSSSSLVNFNIRVDLNRTVFGVSPQDVVCLEQTHCVYHVHFGAEDRLILHVPRERDAGNAVFTITTSCRPRVFFYALLFILIPILFLVFLGAVIRAFSYLANSSTDEGKYLRFRLFGEDERTRRRRRRLEELVASQSREVQECVAVGSGVAVSTDPAAEHFLVYHVPGLDPPPRTPPPCYASLRTQQEPPAVPEDESLLGDVVLPIDAPTPIQPPRYSEVLRQENAADLLTPLEPTLAPERTAREAGPGAPAAPSVQPMGPVV
ncbi:uncharacterized protein LOC119443120 isoform X2 [Dermacentor silvarum]|uniref:uncharacterized protein LOC119443120 isoform X2 n=1 Tax=Dermacentor silvarum TaxID=543639 RepID=UPI0021014D34|nr:uncharacterized protein LOC119443120 isoform X2 [Dermacentor silvarum]